MSAWKCALLVLLPCSLAAVTVLWMHHGREDKKREGSSSSRLSLAAVGNNLLLLGLILRLHFYGRRQEDSGSSSHLAPIRLPEMPEIPDLSELIGRHDRRERRVYSSEDVQRGKEREHPSHPHEEEVAPRDEERTQGVDESQGDDEEEIRFFDHEQPVPNVKAAPPPASPYDRDAKEDVDSDGSPEGDNPEAEKASPEMSTVETTSPPRLPHLKSGSRGKYTTINFRGLVRGKVKAKC